MSVKDPPKIAMWVFFWALFAFIVSFILYIAEKFHDWFNWKYELWSVATWLTVIFAILLAGVGLFLSLNYLLEAWTIRWKTRMRVRLFKAKQYEEAMTKKLEGNGNVA